MALNKFADLSPAEFQQKMSCRGNSDDPTCPSDHNCTSIAKTSATSWDWTKKGAVTAIKNQGDCGSCWTFGATGGLEGRYYLDNNVLLSFSEQYIVDCDEDGSGCGGGFAS
mmetsp:Transcript_34324/g.31037  ORF Transcript_34324/g.31037 Transcript_34324/m.31037 type:complete len:111 (-) Transcript_34324:524-856(-)